MRSRALIFEQWIELIDEEKAGKGMGKKLSESNIWRQVAKRIEHFFIAYFARIVHRGHALKGNA